jgi:hypothetical protein
MHRGLYLVFTACLFLVNNVQFTSDIWRNRRSATRERNANSFDTIFYSLQVLWVERCTLRLQAKRGEFIALIRLYSRIFFYSPISGV